MVFLSLGTLKFWIFLFIQDFCYFLEFLVFYIYYQLSYCDENLRHQHCNAFIIFNKIWKSIDQQICAQFIPKFFEFWGQCKCRASIIRHQTLRKLQILQLFDISLLFTCLCHLSLQISLYSFKSLSLFKKFFSDLIFCHKLNCSPLIRFIVNTHLLILFVYTFRHSLYIGLLK